MLSVETDALPPTMEPARPVEVRPVKAWLAALVSLPSTSLPEVEAAPMVSVAADAPRRLLPPPRITVPLATVSPPVLEPAPVRVSEPEPSLWRVWLPEMAPVRVTS